MPPGVECYLEWGTVTLDPAVREDSSEQATFGVNCEAWGKAFQAKEIVRSKVLWQEQAESP